jgi:hypothetical protein
MKVEVLSEKFSNERAPRKSGYQAAKWIQKAKNCSFQSLSYDIIFFEYISLR